MNATGGEQQIRMHSNYTMPLQTRALATASASDLPIEFNGRTYVSDETKGYILARISHAFPVTTMHGGALMPNVVAKSWKSIIGQGCNIEHAVQAYGGKEDKFIGTVLDATFPETPAGGWKLGSMEDAPGIKIVVAFSKNASGMDRILSRHLTGRHAYTVSMEVTYAYEGMAFAVQLKNGATPKHETPDGMVAAGWELVPWAKADQELLAVFHKNPSRITKPYKGRKVVYIMGGLDQPVHYGGVAIVEYGAEPTAEILQMAASGSAAFAALSLRPLFEFVERINAASGNARASAETASPSPAPASAPKTMFLF